MSYRLALAFHFRKFSSDGLDVQMFPCRFGHPFFAVVLFVYQNFDSFQNRSIFLRLSYLGASFLVISAMSSLMILAFSSRVFHQCSYLRLSNRVSPFFLECFDRCDLKFSISLHHQIRTLEHINLF